MAKDFAKKFYNSKEWKETRDAYFIANYGLCELCERPGEEVHHKKFLTPLNVNDSNITSNWDNLQLLCKRCHDAQHNKAYEMRRIKKRKDSAIIKDVAFNDNGDLIEKKSVHIVWGAPCSGKTTYVKDHKSKYDIVVDLDYIMSALSLSSTRDRSPDTFPFALECVFLLHELIGNRKYFFDDAWIITTMPKKQKRNQLAKQLKAELIHIDTDMESCLMRAKVDDNRADKELQFKIIKKYFDELEV